MAQEIIGVGSAADDGTGDPLRTAFTKVNANFTDLFAFLSVADDTTPQLGGDLDVNGSSIVSVSAGDIAITPDTTGNLVLDGLSWPQADGTSGQVLTTDGAGQLSWTSASGGLTDLVDDTTPQLGGPLDVNGNAIVSASAGDISVTPDTTGSVVLDGVKWPQADGTSGQVLTTDGAGQASWTTASSGITSVADDTTPELGGDLDVSGQSIVSTSNGNILVTPNGTGEIQLDGLSWPQADGASGQAIITDGAGQLSFSTISGGGGGLDNIVEDTTPELGGDLSVNGNSIVSASNGDIAITPNGSGSIVLDGVNWPQADGTLGQYLTTDGAAQLSWASITSLKATTAQIRDGTADRFIDPANLHAALAIVSLTDGATISWDMDSGINFDVTLGGNRTLAAPTNVAEGHSGVLQVIQDATGSRTLTWNAAYKFPGGTAPTLSTTANAVDTFTWYAESTSSILIGSQGAFS